MAGGPEGSALRRSFLLKNCVRIAYRAATCYTLMRIRIRDDGESSAERRAPQRIRANGVPIESARSHSGLASKGKANHG